MNTETNGIFNNQSHHVVFLGLADYYEEGAQPFPFGGVDVYQLSCHKLHIVYPGIISSNHWVVSISHKFLREVDLSNFSIRVCDAENNEVGICKFSDVNPQVLTEIPTEKSKSGTMLIFKQVGDEHSLFHFTIDTIIKSPGTYIVQSILNGISVNIGTVEFHYKKGPILTSDQIMAIESTANSAKAVMMNLGCKLCSSKLNVYAGINRSPDLEKDGFLWYSDIDDDFTCSCKKTKFSLKYIKESMHGLLLKDISMENSGLSYVRRYGHQQVGNTVNKFSELIATEKNEEPIQDFIEENPILLSRFTAARIFKKPQIVGRFQADFIILDSKHHLWFIELEKPSLLLFKKNGHPTSVLMHAFEQVNDWLQQYRKYPGAILEALNLKDEDVVAVQGAVIAGRKRSVSIATLQRFLLNPPYSNIEFLTIDELGESLMTISSKLA